MNCSKYKEHYGACVFLWKSKALATRSNIVCQTSEFCLSSNVGKFGHVGKHCLTSRIAKQCFLKTSKTFNASHKQKTLDEQGFATWANGETFCLICKLPMFDKHCLVVWAGPNDVIAYDLKPRIGDWRNFSRFVGYWSV